MDTINIENISFNIEDEELPEIEYYQIVSIDEIIKENPTFIAFSREDIYNELYNFFKDKTKVTNFIELFYNTINNKSNKLNINNFVIVSDAYKKDLTLEDIDKFTSSIKKLNKIQYKLGQNGKNKLWFALEYNDDDDKLRFKAIDKTIIDLNNDVNYYVFKDDDTNIPILGVYYLTPKTTNYDLLNTQIVSHLYKKEKLKYINTSDLINNTFKELIEKATPEIPLEKIQEEEELDYTNINAVLKKYNYDMDFIKLKDYEKLNELLTNILKEEKINKPIHNNIKIKPIKLINNKYTFFDNLQKIKALLEITKTSYDKYNEIIINLNDEKGVIPELLYNNINDIINAINTSIISLDDIVENIRIIKKSKLIDFAINTITEYNEINIEEIIILLNNLEKNYNRVKNNIKDIYGIFFEFNKEEHEIQVGNSIKNYEGIPSKDTNKFEDLNDDYDVDESILVNYNDNNKFNIYYNMILYKNEEGFAEMLKIILPYINNLCEKSKLPINYETLCNMLFNNYRGIPTKINIIKKLLKEKDLTISNEEIDNIISLTDINSNIEDNPIYIELINTNIIYYDSIKNILYKIIIWWSIELQKEIINDTLIYIINNLYPPSIDSWDIYGYPYLDTLSNGTFKYLVSVFKKISLIDSDIDDKNQRNINNINKNIKIPEEENLLKILNKKCENDFKDELVLLREIKIDDTKKPKNKDIGKEFQKKLVSSINSKKYENIINEYIGALLYMPSVKFEKIHKYLLGCCLQQINKNFIADSDLIKNRKDLMGVKVNFAKMREINKPRYLKFHPTKIEKFEIIKNKIIKLKSINENLDNDITFEKLLENMKGKNVLLSDYIIDILIKNPKDSEAYVNKYINLLIYTSSNKKGLLELYNSNSLNNYKDIILSIKLVLYNNLHEKYDNILNLCLIPLNHIIIELYLLNSIINDNNKNEIKRIISYIIARCLCLPSSPDDIVGNVLKPKIEMDNDIIIKIAKELYTTIIKKIKNSNVLTIEEQVDFINKIREENKNKTLATMNSQNEDERNIMRDLKKIGINISNDDEDDNPVINKDDIEDEEESGEADFIIEDEEADYDAEDRSLDIKDFGFIYAD